MLTSPWFDVFLSFSGEDIRRTFVCHLNRSLDRKGIRVFENEKRESSNIYQDAIVTSKFAIIVISKSYASSPWCLKELDQIIERERIGSLIVFPVFYGIQPSAVIGEFTKRLVKQNPEIEERWRKSLTKLLDIPAEHSNIWEDDTKLIQKITDDIWDKLRSSRSRSRFSGLVGMERRISSVYKLLNLDSIEDEVRIIGIWGEVGLGKRTLAQVVYKRISQRFDVCVQLQGVDMNRHGHNSLALTELLQSKFIDALAMNSWDGTARVLLVAEDVKESKQINIFRKVVKQFGTWSRVIVTCENQNLLHDSCIGLSYQVEPLTYDEALELLSLHAFNQTHPPEGFEKFFKYAVHTSRKIFPWWIASLGSELFGRDKKEWQDVMSTDVQLYFEERLHSISDAEDEFRRWNDTKFKYIGMDCHIEAVCGGLMELEADKETRIVGIWGVGGGGKTILARCVFDKIIQDFHTKVFLENVGKIYREHGSSRLQEELLWETIQRSSNNGSNVTKARLRYRKVLLVVDGVDDNKQFEDVKKVATRFGAGSRIIVITRDKNLLIDNGVKHVYEVECLKFHEALQLFYQFAFKQKTPPSRFRQLSIRAVQLSGHIPLGLEVLALSLHGKSENEWEIVLKKLETHESSIFDVEVSSYEDAEDSFGDMFDAEASSYDDAEDRFGDTPSDENGDEPSTLSGTRSSHLYVNR